MIPLIEEAPSCSRRLVIVVGVASVLALGVVLAALYNWRLLTTFPPDHAMVVEGDFWEVHVPFHSVTARAWHNGGPPLWASQINAGHPALADSQFGALYPPNILAGLLLGEQSYTADMLIRQSIVHVALGFWGAFLLFLHLARQRRGGWKVAADLADAPTETSTRMWSTDTTAIVAAGIGATCYAFSGYATSFPLQNPVILEVMAWQPWMLLGIDIAIVSGNVGWSALASAPVALSALAGHPATLAYGLEAAVLLWLWRTVALWRVRGVRAALPGAVAGAIPIPLGLGVAGAQLLPTLELMPLTVRAAPGFSFVATGFAPRELTGLLLREGFGGAAPLYLGVVAIGLACSALLFRQRAGGLRGFWLTLAAVSLFVSFGGQSFLFDLLYVVVPVFRLFRQQERITLLVTVAVAALAAEGADELCRSWCVDASRRAVRKLVPYAAGATVAMVVVGVVMSGFPVKDQLAVWGVAERDAWWWLVLLLVGSLGLVALWYRRLVPAPMWMALVGGALLLDLFSAHPTINLRTATAVDSYALPALLGTVVGDRNRPFRVSTEGLLPADGNEGLLTGLDDIIGSTPLQLQLFADLQTAEQRHELTELQRLALLDVRYMVTKRDFPPADRRFTLLGREGELRLYRLSDETTLPRAWLVHAAVRVSSWDDLATLGTIDARSIAVVTEPTDLPVKASRLSGESVAYDSYAANRSVVRVQAAQSGLLVFSEMWYPGWQATVDGRATPIIRVDHALRAVGVAEGPHTVTMSYEPGTLRSGKLLALISAGIALVLALVGGLVATFRRPNRFVEE